MTGADELKPRTFNPEGVPAPPATYSHVAVTPLLSSSRLITLAGLTGCDPASSDNPSTLREQASIAYAKVQTCLAAAGASPRDIVQVGFWPCPIALAVCLLTEDGDHAGQALYRQGHG